MRSQDPCKQLRWRPLTQQLTAKSLLLFQISPSKMVAGIKCRKRQKFKLKKLLIQFVSLKLVIEFPNVKAKQVPKR